MLCPTQTMPVIEASLGEYMCMADGRQVWWFSGGMLKGKLSVHNIATGRTHDMEAMPPVTCLQLDGNSIWSGHKAGLVRVWSESTSHPVCPTLTCCSSDIT